MCIYIYIYIYIHTYIYIYVVNILVLLANCILHTKSFSGILNSKAVWVLEHRVKVVITMFQSTTPQYRVLASSRTHLSVFDKRVPQGVWISDLCWLWWLQLLHSQEKSTVLRFAVSYDLFATTWLNELHRAVYQRQNKPKFWSLLFLKNVNSMTYWALFEGMKLLALSVRVSVQWRLLCSSPHVAVQNQLKLKWIWIFKYNTSHWVHSNSS